MRETTKARGRDADRETGRDKWRKERQRQTDMGEMPEVALSPREGDTDRQYRERGVQDGSRETSDGTGRDGGRQTLSC